MTEKNAKELLTSRLQTIAECEGKEYMKTFTAIIRTLPKSDLISIFKGAEKKGFEDC